MTRAAWWLATWFGCGYWPKGPGTAGSLGGVLAAWLYLQAPGARMWHLAVLAAALFLPSVWATDRVIQGSGKKDPQVVVVDEVLGQWVTLAAAPAFTWGWVALGFGLFRLFDIWKPAPVRQAESLSGGVGVVADDIVAGLYGAVVLLVVGWFNRG